MFQYADNSWIYDLTDGTYIVFQLLPQDLSDSKSATYIPYPIIGRSVPLIAYEGSTARTISLTLEFWTAPVQDDDGPDPDTIKQWMDKLRSYTYADYSQGGVLPPHRVIVRVGDAFAMEAVITSYTLTPHKPWTDQLLLPFGQKMQLTFIEVADIPLSQDEVAQGSDGTGGTDFGVQF